MIKMTIKMMGKTMKTQNTSSCLVQLALLYRKLLLAPHVFIHQFLSVVLNGVGSELRFYTGIAHNFLLGCPHPQWYLPWPTPPPP